MEVWGGHEVFQGCVSVPGNDVFVSCRPWEGDARGGDIYYVSNCAAGLITRFMLADVAGHGQEAAETARGLRNLMRRHINTPDQRRFARSLNKAFGRLSSSGRFATALLLTYFSPTDHLIVCNAGHPRPLHFDARRGRWQLLDAATPGALPGSRCVSVGVANLPLGIVRPTSYQQFAVQLGPGDLVVLYSDALIEAAAPGRAALGEAGLLEAAHRIDPRRPDEAHATLLREVARRSGSADLNDDATLIVLHHNASDPPKQGLKDRVVMLARMLGLR